MVEKPLDPFLQNILVQFRKLQCPLSNLKERHNFIQLQFNGNGTYDGHYEWWLKEAGKLHVAVHFERKGPGASEENWRNAEQLRPKIEIIASAVDAQPEVDFWNPNKVWATAALEFDVTKVNSVNIANKLANVMALLVLMTIEEVLQMFDIEKSKP